MKQMKAFKYRVYPTPEQIELINKSIGCSRFVYNHFLARRIETYEQEKRALSYNACSAELTALKCILEWLREVDSTCLQSALRDLDEAYQRFFKAKKGFPNFKKKHGPKQSYTSKCNNNSIRVEGNLIQFPKLGKVQFAKSRECGDKIISATIRRNPTGKYFVSVLCEVEIEELPQTNNAMGVDLGIKDFAITSDGYKVHSPKYYRKMERKLAREQQKLSRKAIGSRNREKQRIKVAKVHEKIRNMRQDFLYPHLNKIRTFLLNA